MEQEFYVLKDEEGVLRPKAFIARKGASGETEKELYTKRLEKGQEIVLVKLVEV